LKGLLWRRGENLRVVKRWFITFCFVLPFEECLGEHIVRRERLEKKCGVVYVLDVFFRTKCKKACDFSEEMAVQARLSHYPLLRYLKLKQRRGTVAKFLAFDFPRMPVLHTHSMSVCFTTTLHAFVPLLLIHFHHNAFFVLCGLCSILRSFHNLLCRIKSIQKSWLGASNRSITMMHAHPALPFYLHCMNRDVVLYIERHLLCFACVCVRRLFSLHVVLTLGGW
jgi:hypothetical protein